MSVYKILPTPLGDMLAVGEGEALTVLDFVDARHCPAASGEAGESPVLTETARWLAVYFSGRAPDFTPPLAPAGTPFQQIVWGILRDIPWNVTVSYGGVARRAERLTGRRASAQAVGQAVGRNPISLIIPCHRVVGADGSLTGYGGGLDRKAALLRLEAVRQAPRP